MARTKKKKKQSVSILNNGNIKGIIGGLVIVCLIIATITMCKGCGSSDKKINFSEREAYRYNNALEQVAEVDLILESISNPLRQPVPKHCYIGRLPSLRN